MLLLLASAWPKPVNVYLYNHIDRQSFIDEYANAIDNNIEQIKEFVNFIPDHQPSQKVCSDQACTIFTEKTQLQASQYFDFQAFIEVVMDPMMAMSYTDSIKLGYSFRINENLPFSVEAAEFIQQLIISYESVSATKSFKALSVAGYFGLLTIKTDDFMAAFTQDYNQECVRMKEGATIISLPPYNEQDFTSKLEEFANSELATLSQSFLEYILAPIEPSDFVLFIRQFTYVKSQIIGFLNYKSQDLQFSTLDGEYLRQVATKENAVQSSCRTNLEFVVASDFRTVAVERQINSSMEKTNDFDTFTGILRVFPFRTEQTTAIIAYDQEHSFETLQKCSSVFDGNNIAACSDLPPSCNLASLLCSLLIVVITIGAWVYGCLYSSKQAKKE